MVTLRATRWEVQYLSWCLLQSACRTSLQISTSSTEEERAIENLRSSCRYQFVEGWSGYLWKLPRQCSSSCDPTRFVENKNKLRRAHALLFRLQYHSIDGSHGTCILRQFRLSSDELLCGLEVRTRRIEIVLKSIRLWWLQSIRYTRGIKGIDRRSPQTRFDRAIGSRSQSWL